MAQEAADKVRDSRAGAIFVFPQQDLGPLCATGRELLERSITFWDWMMRCDKALGSYVDWSILDVVRDDIPVPDAVRDDATASVAFGVGVSLARVWQMSGVAMRGARCQGNGVAGAQVITGRATLPEGAANALNNPRSWLWRNPEQPADASGTWRDMTADTDATLLEISPACRTGQAAGQWREESALGTVTEQMLAAATRLALLGVRLDWNRLNEALQIRLDTSRTGGSS